jgi:hypothetical protein
VARPTFFIVGAARCGTTSFVGYLDQHPDVFMAPHKESHFFSQGELPPRFSEPDIPGVRRLEDYLIGDAVEYEHLFDGVRGERAIGESSVYYLCLPDTPVRIACEVPDAKIIVLLRNPVDRAHSAYLMLARDGRESLPFEESLALEPERRRQWYEPIWWYTELSRYAPQIERYFAAFGRERVHVILTEELEAHPERTLHDTFCFLGLRPDVPVDTSWRRNAGGTPRARSTRPIQDVMYSSNAVVRGLKSLVPEHARARLGDQLLTASLERAGLPWEQRLQLWNAFQNDVARLEHLLQRPLSLWSVSPTPATGV